MSHVSNRQKSYRFVVLYFVHIFTTTTQVAYKVQVQEAQVSSANYKLSVSLVSSESIFILVLLCSKAFRENVTKSASTQQNKSHIFNLSDLFSIPKCQQQGIFQSSFWNTHLNIDIHPMTVAKKIYKYLMTPIG